MATMKIALLQTASSKDVGATVDRVIKSIKELLERDRNIRLVILPESFNCTYGPECFAKCAEHIPDGKTSKILSKTAKELGIYIIGGSIIEVDAEKKYHNTCTIWSPTGDMIGKHRKVHLFDMNIKTEGGGVSFKESDYLTPGNDFTIVNVDGHKIGIAICHDMRFEEMAKIYRKEGCEMIVYPAQFCTTQGPMHWELILRARAVDNEVYVAGVCGSRDTSTNYVPYGHTMIVDPWGHIVKQLDVDEGVIVADIDFKKVAEVREQIPIFKQRRTDMYDTISKKAHK